MAERVLIVCDVCGKAPAETVGIKLRDQSLQKDLCSAHLAELVKGSRTPRRGRPRVASAGSSTAPKRRGRPRKVA